MIVPDTDEPLWVARKFRAAPLIVEAVQFNGWNVDELAAFTGLGADDTSPLLAPLERLVIETPRGEITANVDDWVVRSMEGEIFVQTNPGFCGAYEPVVDT